MKLNKDQQLFIDTMLEALDNQFNDANDKLEELYKTYNKDLKKFEEKVASIIYEYEVKGEVLELTPKQKQQLKSELKKELGDTFKEEYYQEKEFIKSQLTEKGQLLYDYKSFLLNVGVDFDMLPLPTPTLRRIVLNKVNGLDWSERLWNNKKDVESKLQKEFRDLIDGKTDINKIKSNIRKTFNSNKYNTDRLVRNELARVQSEINEVHDKNHGVEYQMYLSTLDKKTTEFCKDRDGKVYKFDDPNKPIPPTGTHINCRSTLCSIPSKDFKLSTRRDNETNEIIEYQTYREWEVKKNKPIEVKTTQPQQTTGQIKFNKAVEPKLKDLGVSNYAKEFGEYFKNADEQLLNTFAEYIPKINYTEGKTSAHLLGGISLSKSSKMTKIDKYASVFAHETGHGIDFTHLYNAIVKTEIDFGKYMKSNNPLNSSYFYLDEAIKKDAKTLNKLLKEDNLKELMNYITGFNNKGKNAESLSDAIEGITGGKIVGGAGHGKAYWKITKDMKHTETFADFTTIFSNPDEECLAIIDKYLPNVKERYFELLSDMESGNTDTLVKLLKQIK